MVTVVDMYRCCYVCCILWFLVVDCLPYILTVVDIYRCLLCWLFIVVSGCWLFTMFIVVSGCWLFTIHVNSCGYLSVFAMLDAYCDFWLCGMLIVYCGTDRPSFLLSGNQLTSWLGWQLLTTCNL
jgi:hypothetical protein